MRHGFYPFARILAPIGTGRTGFAQRTHFASSHHHGALSAHHDSGFTVVEVAVAVALLTIGLGGLFALLGTAVKETVTGNAASVAQQNTSARMDQMKNLTWANLTNANYISTNVLGSPSSPTNFATISSEVIAVSPAAVPQSSPLPSPIPAASATPGPGFSVTKTATGTPSISPSPYPNLLPEKLVNITITTRWLTSGKSHQRQLSSLISRSGSPPSKPVPSPTP
jgi:type II secretory pathway pseudopilin PulG